MAAQCTETFDRLAGALGGFSCRDAPAVVHVRSPLELSNATLPVLELTIVVIAVAALVHAIRRLHRDGDPVNLALWFATVVYLFVIEIPLYFPNVFGVEDALGMVFAHNVFTVQFLFDRLPLYIVALYPAMISVAYEIVRTLGVFRDRGVLLGVICVGFVHHCFYEVFDQLGPQLRWWAWNIDNPLNQPWLAGVPMTSMFIFATLGPVVVTALVMVLVGRRAPAPRGGGLVWRTALAGVATPLGLVILSIPTSLFGGDEPNVGAQAIVFSVEILVVAVVGAVVLAGQWHRIRSGIAVRTEPNTFLRVFGTGYLGVLAILWVTALPDYFGASSGITVDGTRIGSLPYAATVFAAAVLCLAAALSATGARASVPVAATRQPQPAGLRRGARRWPIPWPPRER